MFCAAPRRYLGRLGPPWDPEYRPRARGGQLGGVRPPARPPTVERTRHEPAREHPPGRGDGAVAGPPPRVPLLVGAGADRSAADRLGAGLVLHRLRRQALPGLRLPAGQRQHRPPAPPARRGDPGVRRPADDRPALVRQRRAQRGGAVDRRVGTGRPEPGPVHQRRRGRGRERRPHRPAVHRPAEDPVHLSQLPRRHLRGDRADRRAAPLGVGAGGARQRALLGPVPVPLRVPLRQPGAGGRTGPRTPPRRDHGGGAGEHRRDHPGTGRGDQRHPGTAAGLPRRGAPAVRRARHRHDRRRGDGRLRPLRRVVRRGPLAGDAGPDHLREGRQLRLRAAGRGDRQRPDRGELPGAALPGRAHLFGTPAGLRLRRRLHQHLQGRGDRRARPHPRHGGDRPRAGQDRRTAPVGGRGARAGRVLGGGTGPGQADARAAGAVQRRPAPPPRR